MGGKNQAPKLKHLIRLISSRTNVPPEKASGHQNYLVIKSENEGEIISPSEELGGVAGAAGAG